MTSNTDTRQQSEVADVADEELGICIGCCKPIRPGQVVIIWDDEIGHANCRDPFNTDIGEGADLDGCPPPAILLGSPARRIPLTALRQPAEGLRAERELLREARSYVAWFAEGVNEEAPARNLLGRIDAALATSQEPALDLHTLEEAAKVADAAEAEADRKLQLAKDEKRQRNFAAAVVSSRYIATAIRNLASAKEKD